jgi:hypothetical protein
MGLADDLVEILGAIFAGKNLVAHGMGESNLAREERRNGNCAFSKFDFPFNPRPLNVPAPPWHFVRHFP